MNPARAGHVYPTYEYEVSHEKVREYALATRAVGWAAATAPGSGPSNHVVAPLTFAACFAAPAALSADPQLGWHWNLVHAKQEYEFHRVVRVGDVLACTPTITSIISRGRTELLTVEVDCEEAGSHVPVLKSRSTIAFFSEGDA